MNALGTLARAAAVWRWSFLVALAISALIVLQDLLYSRLPSDLPLNIAIAQYTLPWLTWALLAACRCRFLAARHRVSAELLESLEG